MNDNTKNAFEDEFEIIKEKGEIGDWPEEFEDFRIWAPKKEN